jgi:hypothetical protein
MKKDYIIIITVIIIIFAAILSIPKELFKVHKIENPATVYIDTNNNYIFDEKEPFIVENLYYIDKNTDYSNHPVFKNLTEEQKILLEYMSKELSQNLLKNKHVKIKDSDIITNNKSYKQTMLDSKLAYDDSEESQKELLDNISKINTDDYVIYNSRSKKYHKLTCEETQKIAKYKIVKRDSLDAEATPCKACHNLNNKEAKAKTKNPQKKDVPQIPNVMQYANKKDIYETENIKIFFIDLNEIFTPSNKCKHASCKALKNEIDNSKTSIDFAIYGINNQPEIVNALINAKNRGVKVRWVYDINKSSQNYYEDNEKLAQIITDYNTDEAYENANQSAIMHNKFFVFDNQKVWTGSANITTTDLSGFNANYSVLINSKELADIYTKEFEQMYNGNFHKYKTTISPVEIKIGNSTIEALFSPKNDIVNTRIIPLINNAKEYIYLPVFFISHKGIANALIDARQRGVEVRVIHDATNSHANNSTHKMLRTGGVKVKTENYAGKMHMKSMVIDDKISVIGSMNFTNSGNNKNDENVLIINDSNIAKFIKNNFIYLWNKIPEKYEHYDPRAESKESVGSCEDGIDNNFDNKIDAQDEGCRAK